MALFYRPEDVSWLADAQLFPALRTLLSQSPSLAIANAARSLFSHLASICLWWSPAQLQPFSTVSSASALSSPRASLSHSLMWSSTTLQSLQHELFSAIVQELSKEMSALAAVQRPTLSSAAERKREQKEREEKSADNPPSASPDASPSSSSAPAGPESASSSSSSSSSDMDASLDSDASSTSSPVDSACYELLTLIFRMRHSPAAKLHLSKSLDALTALLSVFQPSTLRVQRLSVRLVRFMLTDPDIGGKLRLTLGSAASGVIEKLAAPSAAHTSAEKDKEKEKEAALVSAILDRIGQLLVTGDSGDLTFKPSSSALSTSGTTWSWDSTYRVVPRRLSDPHYHHHHTATSSSFSSSSSSDQFNLSILNTDPEAMSGASFASLVLAGLKDVLKASSRSLKSDLRSQLSSAAASSSSVVIMTGSRDEMGRVARICAKRGFGCQIAPAPVQDGYLRNEKLAQLNPSAVQCGRGALELAGELVTLLRVLSQSPLWAAQVEAQLTARLAQLQRCSAQLSSASSASAPSAAGMVAAPLSALAVLGGFAEVLRLGGRVQVHSDDSEETSFGVLVTYERGESHAQVVMEGESQPVTVDVSRLTAAASPYSAAMLLGKPAVVDDVLRFLQESSDAVRKAARDDKTDPFNVSSDRSSSEAEQLRLTSELSVYSLRALCAALADAPVLAGSLSSHSSLMAYLIATAKQSQASSSLEELEEFNVKCLERFLSLQHPPLYPSTHRHQQTSDQELSALLPYFPFASQAKRLPTAFTSEHARFIIFEDAAKRTLQYTKDQHGNSGSEFSLSRSGASGSSGSSGSSSAIRRIEEQLRADSSDEYTLLGNAGVPRGAAHVLLRGGAADRQQPHLGRLLPSAAQRGLEHE